MQISTTPRSSEATKQKSERMSRLVRDYKDSGLTIKQYCAVNRIKEKTFYYWLRKYNRADIIPAMPSIVPVDISAANTENNDAPALFAELRGLKLYQAVPAEYLLALLNN